MEKAKILCCLLALRVLSFCQQPESSPNIEPPNKSVVILKGMDSGFYVMNNIRISITGSLDSIVVDAEPEVLFDIILPNKKEYDFCFYGGESVILDYDKRNVKLNIISNGLNSKNQPVINYYRSLYYPNGLNDSIKKLYSNELTQLSKSNNSELLFHKLHEILLIRISHLEDHLPAKEHPKVNSLIANDLELSSLNSFFRRKNLNNFSLKLIDSLLNNYSSIPDSIFFKNHHNSLLFRRLIAMSFESTSSSKGNINDHAYKIIGKYLHPTVRIHKQKSMAINALNNGDTTFASLFLSEYSDSTLTNEVHFNLQQFRTKSKSDGVFQHIDGNLYSKSDIFSQFNRNYIIIDVWASWCAPCIHELQNYRRDKDELANLDADLLIISIDEEIEAWRKMNQKLQLPSNVSFRITGNYFSFFNHEITAIPTKFLLQKNGIIKAIPNNNVIKYLMTLKTNR